MAEILAIIPARGGSKGVPGKNKRLLDGKPLIGYAIEAALSSKLITHIVVNTDDADIIEIASHYKVYSILRDASLAQDNSPVYAVIETTLLSTEEATGKKFEYVILLQPTSPFRTGTEADAAIEMIQEHPDAEGLISVHAVEDFHPSRMYRVDESKKMHPLWDNGETLNRQELNNVYIRDGAFYIARCSAMLAQHTIMPRKKIAWERTSQWQVNIDTEKDFMLAELIVTQWKEQVTQSS